MKDWNLILIALLLISCIIIQDLYCNRGKGQTLTHTDTIRVYDTNTYIRFKDSLQIQKKILPDTIPVFDTTKTIIEFFTKNIYTDSMGDSNVLIVITDTLFKNQIVNRKYQYNLLKPQTIITNTYTVNQNPLSFGVSVGYGVSKDGLSPYVGVGFSYRLWR